MKRLGIHIDPVLLLRERSGTRMPDPLSAIAMIELAGVDSIVYTLPDRITPPIERDLRLLKEAIHTHFNLRLRPETSEVQMAIDARAEMATFVGMDGGRVVSLQADQMESTLTALVRMLRQAGAVVNVLIEPDAHQIKSAATAGCDYVELNANRYVHAESLTLMEQELDNLKTMALAAAKLKLGVTLSGDLDYSNVRALTLIEEIEEINVGHSIIHRALFFGYDQAIRDFAALLK